MARDAENSFNFHQKFYFNAEQNEATSEPRLSVVLHLYRQYFVLVDRSRIDVLSRLWFNSSWNGLDKQSSAEPNIILNFPSDTSFKQPSLFVQAAYDLSAISVN